jgi:hypothetical protein
MGRGEIIRENHIDQPEITPSDRGAGFLCMLVLSYTVDMYSARTEAVGFSEIVVAIC